jgi:hypothetical protein
MSMTLGRAGKLGWLWYQPTTASPYSSEITSVTCAQVRVQGNIDIQVVSTIKRRLGSHSHSQPVQLADHIRHLHTSAVDSTT